MFPLYGRFHARKFKDKDLYNDNSEVRIPRSLSIIILVLVL